MVVEHYLYNPITEEKFYLKIPESYTFGGANTIIVKESATGDGAVVINNGRTQEEIPIEGTLFAVDYKNPSLSYNGSGNLSTLNDSITQLFKLKDDRTVVEFIGPYITMGSNEYYIKSLFFTTSNEENSIGFSMVLTKNRKADVLAIEKNTTLKQGYVQEIIKRNAELDGIMGVGTQQTNADMVIVGGIALDRSVFSQESLNIIQETNDRFSEFLENGTIIHSEY